MRSAINQLRFYSDSAALSLSFLCTLHCLLLPMLVVFLPTTLATMMQNETIHSFLVYLVIPLSIFALGFGCKQHRQLIVFLLGLFGLIFLLSALFIDLDFGGISYEKFATLIGSIMVATGHVLNYMYCKRYCGCEK